MYCSCSTVHDYFGCHFFINKNSVALIFFVHLLVDIYAFYSFTYMLLQSPEIFSNLILLLYFFHLPRHSMVMYCFFYTVSFIRFSTYINHICIVYSTDVLGLFISYFVSLYSLSILFTETNYSWLKYESITDLQIITSILSNLAFANNTILLCLFFYDNCPSLSNSWCYCTIF